MGQGGDESRTRPPESNARSSRENSADDVGGAPSCPPSLGREAGCSCLCCCPSLVTPAGGAEIPRHCPGPRNGGAGSLGPGSPQDSSAGYVGGTHLGPTRAPGPSPDSDPFPRSPPPTDTQPVSSPSRRGCKHLARSSRSAAKSSPASSRALSRVVPLRFGCSGDARV